jgi:arabinan endo-1,5-alpha-L-arabinosidase
MALLTCNAFAQTLPTVEADDSQRLVTLGKRNIHAHDPSTIIRCGDEYWCYSTGRGVWSIHSKDLEHWDVGPRVFEAAPVWNKQVVPGTREMNYWAPDVIHLGDRYLLYYSVSVFGKKTSAIGLATNATLDPSGPKFEWTDEGAVVQSGDKENYNTIDPSVMLDRDGKLWLSFGSYWSGIKLIELDPKTGKRIAPDSPLYSLAWAREIEASCIYRHGDDYFLFVNWGLCCRGVNSTYNIRVGRSSKITGPYLDKDGKDMIKGGGTLIADSDGPFIGPGHAGILEKDGQTWMSMHFYDATRGGLGTLAIREVKWDNDGWPRLADSTGSAQQSP